MTIETAVSNPTANLTLRVDEFTRLGLTPGFNVGTSST